MKIMTVKIDMCSKLYIIDLFIDHYMHCHKSSSNLWWASQEAGGENVH